MLREALANLPADLHSLGTEETQLSRLLAAPGVTTGKTTSATRRTLVLGLLYPWWREVHGHHPGTGASDHGAWMCQHFRWRCMVFVFVNQLLAVCASHAHDHQCPQCEEVKSHRTPFMEAGLVESFRLRSTPLSSCRYNPDRCGSVPDALPMGGADLCRG